MIFIKLSLLKYLWKNFIYIVMDHDICIFIHIMLFLGDKHEAIALVCFRTEPDHVVIHICTEAQDQIRVLTGIYCLCHQMVPDALSKESDARSDSRTALITKRYRFGMFDVIHTKLLSAVGAPVVVYIAVELHYIIKARLCMKRINILSDDLSDLACILESLYVVVKR